MKELKVLPNAFSDEPCQHAYIEDLAKLEEKDRERMLESGVDVDGRGRAGTFVQMDHSVVHCTARQDGLEIMSTSQALEKYDWLKDYCWRLIRSDQDEFTAYARDKARHGYFIRALPGVKATYPLQACLYIAEDNLAQAVHNIVVVEEGAELNVVTGCASAPDVRRGMHMGISEFYVKKNAKLTFTMIHNWAENMHVRPRSATYIEEGGLFLSNYVCLHRVEMLQMYPTAYLAGPGATARFNSILAAPPGTYMDVGSRVVLEAPETRAESIARTITTGGDIISRGHLIGAAEGVKAHLECHGLILSEKGLIHAVPELEARVAGAEMSHEAAVGKIAPEEIEYLMARGLDEEEATATIVRGFLNVHLDGLPPELQREIDKAIEASQKAMV
ncbi:SufB/SufD family protein [Desulforudis sp. DRI-14]|uniref:SufB/SufD family protein n=1 Tax=Desulforudis sp. DRI-14 TaxID=3459793 RepID=UPI004041CAD1